MGCLTFARFAFPIRFQDITSKKWEDVTNLDLYILVQKNGLENQEINF